MSDDVATAPLDLADSYRRMRLIRRIEESLFELKNAGEVPGSIHLCNGQEAIPVGFCAALDDRDRVVATYRGHGWALALGTEPWALLAEAMGRDSSLNGGRGASPYLADPSVGLLGENSIVGAGVPIALGAALSAHRKGSGGVALVSIGDGAMNQGNVHEALNMAAVMRMPLIIVVENNVYSEMSPIKDMIATETLAERGPAYGIPASRVDGNDVVAVHNAALQAIAAARAGDGPQLLECMTARLVGHHSGDVQHYRPRGDVAAAKEVEPLVRFRQDNPGLAADCDRIDDEVEAAVAEAISTARATDTPDPATAKEHVYV